MMRAAKSLAFFVKHLLVSVIMSMSIIGNSWALVVDGSQTVSLLAVISAPEERNQAYFLSSEGEVFPVGGAPVFSPNPLFPGSDRARKLVISPKTRGYYILENDGEVHAFGDAVLYSSGSVWPGEDHAKDMSLTPSGSGYYILADNGDVLAFGDAVDRNSVLWPLGEESGQAIAVTPTGLGYYVLTAKGDVFVFGDAVDRNSSLWDGVSKTATDMKLTFDGQGYWILANDSETAAFGNASPENPPFTVGDASTTKAIDVSYNGQGYYFVENDGQLYPLGDADVVNGLPAFTEAGNVTPPDPVGEPMPVDDPPSLGNIQKPLHQWADTQARVLNNDNDNKIEFEITYDMDQLIANASSDPLMSSNAHVRQHLDADTLHQITYFWVVLYRLDTPQGYVNGVEGNGNQFIGGYYFGLFAAADSAPLRGILRVPNDFAIGGYRLDVKTRVGTFDFNSFFSPFVAYDTFVIDHFRPANICDFKLVRKDNADVINENVPIRILAGETRNVDIEVRNTGTSIWTAPKNYKLAGDTSADDANLSAADLIKPNQTKNFAFDITAPAAPGVYSSSWRMSRTGIHDFGEPVNQDIEVLDSSLDYPDLSTNDAVFTAAPDDPSDNGSVLLRADVTNTGTAPAYDVEVVFYDGHPDSGGTKIGSSIVLDSILAAETLQASTFWTYPGGSHEIFVFIDPSDQVIESDEVNNGASILVPNPNAALFVDDFEDNNFSANSLGFWTGANFLTYDAVDPDVPGNHIRTFEWGAINDWWASLLWDGNTHLDASGMNTLSFRMKAQYPGETITVKLEDASGQFPPNGIFRYAVNNVSATWQLYNIALSDFKNDLGQSVDPSSLSAVVILFDDPVMNSQTQDPSTVWMDDVSFK